MDKPVTTLKFPQSVPQSINLQIAYELVMDAVDGNGISNAQKIAVLELAKHQILSSMIEDMK